MSSCRFPDPSAPRSGPVVAIATGILGKSTETGARRHVEMLFGGRSIVIAERCAAGAVLLRPTFVQHPDTLAGRIESVIGQPIGQLRHGVPNVPFGGVRRRMEDFLRQNGAVAILCEFGHIACNLAPVGAALNLPVFAYFRGFDASKRLREPKVVRRYLATMPRLDGIIAVSQFLLDNLAAHGIHHPRQAVIPTGVDTSLFTPGRKDPGLALTVGRLVPKKAPLLTLEAFATAAAGQPGRRLEVIGDGEMRRDCEDWVRAQGLEDHIVFHGSRDHDFVRARLAEASLFLLHSLTDESGNAEGLPTAIQEAMASGAAIVSTRHAGIPEAVDEGVTGHLVVEGDRDGFARAIGALLTRPDAVAAMGLRARQIAEDRFDVHRLHARLEAMIAEGCARHGLPAPAPSGAQVPPPPQ